jgi:predicted nucleic acid-binding protein
MGVLYTRARKPQELYNAMAGKKTHRTPSKRAQCPKVWCTEHDLTGNGVPDAWIAAAVHANHEHLVTFDRGFARLLARRELTILDPAS